MCRLRSRDRPPAHESGTGGSGAPNRVACERTEPGPATPPIAHGAPSASRSALNVVPHSPCVARSARAKHLPVRPIGARRREPRGLPRNGSRRIGLHTASRTRAGIPTSDAHTERRAAQGWRACPRRASPTTRYTNGTTGPANSVVSRSTRPCGGRIRCTRAWTIGCRFRAADHIHETTSNWLTCHATPEREVGRSSDGRSRTTAQRSVQASWTWSR